LVTAPFYRKGFIPILRNKFEFRNSLPIIFEILFLTDIQKYEFRNALPNLMDDLLLNSNLFIRNGINDSRE